MQLANNLKFFRTTQQTSRVYLGILKFIARLDYLLLPASFGSISAFLVVKQSLLLLYFKRKKVLCKEDTPLQQLREYVIAVHVCTTVSPL